MPRERIPEATEAVQRAIFGPMDRHLRALRERYGVRISARNEALTLEGNDVDAVKDVARRVKRLMARMRSGRRELPPAEVEEMLFGDGRSEPTRERESSRAPARQPGGAPGAPRSGAPMIRGGAPLKRPRPRTPGQKTYVDAIGANDVVIAVGPAGTGKTYLAVVEAVAALRSGSVRRIVLTRPAVEAGEKLGFLPGDFHAKINPYLRPLYDALGELMPWAEVQRYIDSDVIEIVPLAYMRGRTLKGAFIILDEAQNTTPAQMKMFLTRMGDGSKVVINGDVTQIDLPDDVDSGLIESVRILKGVRGLRIIRFGKSDIQRHPLVQRIVQAYERHDADTPGPRARMTEEPVPAQPVDGEPVEGDPAGEGPA